MRYKKFKNANVEISELAVGTWAIGGEQWGTVEKKDSIAAILKMIDSKIERLQINQMKVKKYTEK